MTDNTSIIKEQPTLDMEVSAIDTALLSSNELINTSELSEHLKEFDKTQGHLSNIKKHLSSLVDQLNNTPSMISRAAQAWGKLPVWQKITLGLILIAPLLIAGIVLHFYMLIIASIMTLLVYVPVSLLLDNHFQHDSELIETIKEKILLLADPLDRAIETLIFLQQQLAQEVEHLYQENENLTQIIKKIKEELNSLSSEIMQIQNTKIAFEVTNKKLEDLVLSLKAQWAEQNELIEHIEHEIQETQNKIEWTTSELEKNIVALKDTRENLGKEIDNQESAVVTLKNILKNFSMRLDDEADRNRFMQSINDFLSSNDDCLSNIATKFVKNRDDLQHIEQKLAEISKRYEYYLDKMDEQIENLGNNSSVPLQKHLESPSQDHTESEKIQLSLQQLSEKIREIGLYSVNKDPLQPIAAVHSIMSY